MNFGRVKLPQQTRRQLGAAFDSGKLSHAVLICGGSGRARKAVATLLTQAMVCRTPGERPCLTCPQCVKVRDGVHPDVTVVKPDEGKKSGIIRVEDVRELIIRRCYNTPNEAPAQVFVIEEADAMNIESQNTLLKVIEEPPASARFLLHCQQPGKLLETILSRVDAYNIEEPGAGERESAKIRAACDAVADALAAGDEYAAMMATAPLGEKERKYLTGLCESLASLLRDAIAVKADCAALGRDDAKARALATKFDLNTLLRLEQTAARSLRDAQSTNTQIKLGYCLLTADLFDAASGKDKGATL